MELEEIAEGRMQDGSEPADESGDDAAPAWVDAYEC